MTFWRTFCYFSEVAFQRKSKKKKSGTNAEQQQIYRHMDLGWVLFMSERSWRIQKRIVTYGGSRLINLKTAFVQGTVSAKVIKFKMLYSCQGFYKETNSKLLSGSEKLL